MKSRASIALASCAALACHRAPAPQEPSPQVVAPEPAIGFDELMATLRDDELEDELRVMQAFAKQSGAPAAIPGLLAALRAEAPALDNDVGLTLDFVLAAHPHAPCDMEPLLEAIRRPRWTSQQKCAQALVHLLRRGDGAGRERELAADLVPLLASQRPRVFDAAEACLVALTGEEHGDTPDGWLAWYAARFGTELDMRAAVYEDLLVVRPLADGESARYEVEGEQLATTAELRELVAERLHAARERGLALGVSIQLADEQLADLAAVLADPEVRALLELLIGELGIADVVVSPSADAFRAPWRPAER